MPPPKIPPPLPVPVPVPPPIVPPSNQAPTVNAGSDQNAYEGTIINLSGATADSDGTINSISAVVMHFYFLIHTMALFISIVTTPSNEMTFPSVAVKLKLSLPL